MDALKRAEENKRQNAPGDTGSLSLEARTDDASPLPDLSSHIAAVDADLQAEASGNAAGMTAAKATAARVATDYAARERSAARQAFAAKLQEDDGSQQRKRIYVLIGVGVLAGSAVAAYFGYQYYQISGGSSSLVARNGKAPPVVPPQQAVRPITPAPVVSAAPTATETPAAVVRQGEADAKAVGGSGTSGGVSARPASESAPSAAVKSAPATVRARDEGGGTPIRVVSRVSPLEEKLTRAYAALQRGDFASAAGAYDDALRDDPRQTDALLGMAAIAVRQGNADGAAANYLRVLELDPRNPAAHVGLIGLGAAGDAGQRESRLRSLLTAQSPGSSEAGLLQFALGNLYAAQRRWSEAQQAFFAAHGSDTGNPDYLYNLAVSLDQLHQPTLALRHYEAARAAAAKRPASFDLRPVELRIGELSR